MFAGQRAALARIYHFFATDPNGYRLEVQKFDDPDWDA